MCTLHVHHLVFVHTCIHYRIHVHQNLSQVVTFSNVEPAFVSDSNDLQSYFQQIEERGDAGTPPGKNHPVYVPPLNILLPDRLSELGDHEVVMLPRPKKELIGGDECWTVYRMESLLPHSVVYRESGFLSTDVLSSYRVDDMTALYCSKVRAWDVIILVLLYYTITKYAYCGRSKSPVSYKVVWHVNTIVEYRVNG